MTAQADRPVLTTIPRDWYKWFAKIARVSQEAKSDSIDAKLIKRKQYVTEPYRVKKSLGQTIVAGGGTTPHR